MTYKASAIAVRRSTAKYYARKAAVALGWPESLHGKSWAEGTVTVVFTPTVAIVTSNDWVEYVEKKHYAKH